MLPRSGRINRGLICDTLELLAPNRRIFRFSVMRKSTLGALEGDQSVKSALAEACDEFANGDRRIPAASHRVALLSKSRCSRSRAASP
jgi:hypothetical protein